MKIVYHTKFNILAIILADAEKCGGVSQDPSVELFADPDTKPIVAINIFDFLKKLRDAEGRSANFEFDLDASKSLDQITEKEAASASSEQ